MENYEKLSIFYIFFIIVFTYGCVEQTYYFLQSIFQMIALHLYCVTWPRGHLYIQWSSPKPMTSESELIHQFTQAAPTLTEQLSIHLLHISIQIQAKFKHKPFYVAHQKNKVCCWEHLLWVFIPFRNITVISHFVKGFFSWSGGLACLLSSLLFISDTYCIFIFRV